MLAGSGSIFGQIISSAKEQAPRQFDRLADTLRYLSVNRHLFNRELKDFSTEEYSDSLTVA